MAAVGQSGCSCQLAYIQLITCYMFVIQKLFINPNFDGVFYSYIETWYQQFRANSTHICGLKRHKTTLLLAISMLKTGFQVIRNWRKDVEYNCISAGNFLRSRKQTFGVMSSPKPQFLQRFVPIRIRPQGIGCPTQGLSSLPMTPFPRVPQGNQFYI